MIVDIGVSNHVVLAHLGCHNRLLLLQYRALAHRSNMLCISSTVRVMLLPGCVCLS